MTTMATRPPTFHCFSPHLAGVGALACFLLAAFHVVALTLAQEEPPPWLLCGPDTDTSNGNYTQNSTYQANIHRLSLRLPRNTSSNPVLYATDSIGSVPDMVYALALCRGDANASACESCVATAFRGAQQECPLVKDVMIFYDLCQLRFSNRDFLLDDDYIVDTYFLQGTQVALGTTTGAFDATVRRIMNATADYAAENSSRRFGTGEEGFDDEKIPKIYSMAQCTPDRTVDICRTCLRTIIDQLPIRFNGTNGGGIFGVWCSFRYEVSPFFSGSSLLQLPTFVGTSPAPAPALAVTKSQGQLPPPPDYNLGGDTIIYYLVNWFFTENFSASVCLQLTKFESNCNSYNC